MRQQQETEYSCGVRMSKDYIRSEACDINAHINPITLFGVHVNTTFGFDNQNEFIRMEAKIVHVNVATGASRLHSKWLFHAWSKTQLSLYFATGQQFLIKSLSYLWYEVTFIISNIMKMNSRHTNADTTIYIHTEASCPFKVRGLRFLSQVNFECSFQKTKNSRLIFSIFSTITLAWLDRSVCHIISC